MTEALLALDSLDELCEEPLPIELLKDPYHPGNDVFYQTLNQIKGLINLQSVKLRTIEVQAVRQAFKGLKKTQIAENLDVGYQSVLNYLKKPDSLRLLQLLTHMQILLDGPQKEHRVHMLYRIAIDNECDRPTVAVSAIQEINKMSGVYEPAAQVGGLNVTINNEVLPRGELDKLPEPHIIEAQIIPEE